MFLVLFSKNVDFNFLREILGLMEEKKTNLPVVLAVETVSAYGGVIIGVFAKLHSAYLVTN